MWSCKQVVMWAAVVTGAGEEEITRQGSKEGRGWRDPKRASEVCGCKEVDRKGGMAWWSEEGSW